MKNSATSADLPPLSGPDLAPGERVLASFRPDLDASLHFAEGLLLVTNRRVWLRDASGATSELPRDAGLGVERREHAGVCELFVTGGEAGGARLRCRYTLARARGAAEVAATLRRDAERDGEGDEREATPDDELASGPATRSSLWRLLGFARPRLGMVLLGFGLTLATTGVGLIPPYLTQPLMDNVLVPWQTQTVPNMGAAARTLWLYLGGLGLAAVVAWLLSWAQGAVLAWVSEAISADLRNHAFSHLMKLGLRYFGGKRTGDLIARISTETDRLCSFLSDTLTDFVTDVLMIVGTTAVLFWMDPLLAAAAVVSFPPIAWFMVRVRGSLTHGFLKGGRVWSQMANILADAIPGVRVVKAFSQEQREITRFAQANQRIVQVNNRTNRLWTSFWPLVAMLNQVGLLVVWIVGARQVLHHDIKVGVLTAFIAYITRLYGRVESMSRILGLTQRASAAAQRLFEILDRVPSETSPQSARPLEGVKGEIHFDHVSFRYGTRLVLNDVSFRVAPGEMLGIVGHTGSGKSTVANLVCRFYDAASGQVRLDGADVTTLPVEQYRRHIGIVLQDSFLFFGSIGENIAYGLPGAEPARVLDAARAARAHDFVLKLPEGYDSMVGERGQSLSGGERQRVAIARAILIDPQILVLDEATSAVDVQTEREIQRALDNVVAGRTTIAIAHRLSTLARADRLLVLKDGKVVETGSHRELLALGGEYARLRRAQQKSEPAAVSEPEEEPEDVSAPLQLPRPSDIVLEWSSESDTLTLREAGVAHVVQPRRCFPLSDPDRYVSLVDVRGHELLCLASLGELNAAARAAVEQALDATELLPRLLKIDAVQQEATQSTWQVQTDRGAREFVVDQEDHVRRLSDGRYLITDAHGMRYLVPPEAELDQRSRRLFASFS